MEIKPHLSDEQWRDLLAPPEAGSEHLAECSGCREEHDRLRKLVSVLPEWARSADERPEIFWERQRLAIHSRIGQVPATRQRSTRLVWVTAFVLILLASLILRTGSVRAPVQSGAADPDHELLVAVEQALDGDVPEALEPASLLAGEMTQAAQPNSHSRNSKEKMSDEN
jgi:hypothetical protein